VNLTMKFSEANFRDRTILFLSIPVLYFVYFIALSGAALYVGLCVSATFRTVSMWVGASLVLAAIPMWFYFKGQGTDRRERIDIVFAACVLLLCTATGFLATSINRPNIDDSVYATKAVFYRENPDQALNKTINWIVGLPITAEVPAFQYYETIQAAVAYLFNVPYLGLYHVIFPAIVGFLMSLGTLLALSVFEPRRWMLALGLLLLTLVTVSLGETERTFGNFSIARAFQGKILFFAAGLPIWLYLSLRFFALRRFDTWFALLATGLCLVATTNSAMVLLPLFAGVIFVSYICCENAILTRRNVELGFAYVSALVPVALLAWEFRTIAERSLGTRSLISAGFPLTFGGQLDFFINDRYPLTPILFCAGLSTTLLYSAYRRFFAIWVVLMFVVFLNPLTFGFILKTITPETIYWRLFYLLPFPIIVASAFFTIPKVGSKSAIAIGAVLATFSVAAIWGPTSVIRRQNDATLGWPGFKIEEPTLSAIKEIARTVPTGSMFAPVDIASNMLIYSSKYPQFYMRDDFFGYAAHESGAYQMFVDRTKVYQYLYQDNTSSDARELLSGMLASPDRPHVVVLPNRSASRADIQDLLTSNHYSMRRLSTAPYVLYLFEGSEKRNS
jgi:hypothetical protein